MSKILGQYMSSFWTLTEKLSDRLFQATFDRTKKYAVLREAPVVDHGMPTLSTVKWVMYAYFPHIGLSSGGGLRDLRMPRHHPSML